MLTTKDRQVALSIEDHFELRSFYESYFNALERQDLMEWPEFFSDEGYYTVQSSESHRHGYLVCDIFCDSKGMISDRAQALGSTTLMEKRFVRYFLGSIQVSESGPGTLKAQTSYLVVESVADELPAVFSAGRTFDVISRANGRLLFDRREVVYDHTAIRNSLVFPL